MLLIDPAVGPPALFGVTDPFILALVAYDLVSHGRLHAATLWGGLLVVISQGVSLLLAASDSWLAFAQWVTGM